MIQHDGKLETCPFRVPFFISKKTAREQIPQNNHKYGSRPKDINNNIDASISGSPKDTIDWHGPKVNSVYFEDPYDHINPMDNTNVDTHLADAHEERITKYFEEVEIIDDFNMNTIS